jgi:TetR/AcrR family transcriptional repressor of nem operon
MRYATEHKAQTRDRVLREASAAIRANGAERVSVAAVMARAGLTHGGFYAHFASKDELIAEAITHMFDDRYAKFLERIDTPDARAAMIAFIDSYLSMRHRDAPELGCPIPALAAEAARFPVGAQARFADGITRLTTGVATLLDALALPDAARLAVSVISELVGALGLARATVDNEQAALILEASRDAVKGRLLLTALQAT